MSDTISVVIPFYQRDKGILQKALRSVKAQETSSSIRVLVVDDGSPVAAEEEIAEMGSSAPESISIFRQANQGPGAARNRGLDEVSPDSDFIAFLDSDDVWEPFHIERAVSILRQGYDVFFANLMQLGATVPAFERAGRIDTQEHLPITGGYGFAKDMIAQIITGNVIGTPTVVFSTTRLGDVRFRTEYRRAGEDYLCWLEFARRGAKFAFSTDVHVWCGRGVNIFAGAGWGKEGHLERLLDEAKLLGVLRSEFASTPVLRQSLTERAKTLRVSMARAVLHDMRKGRSVPLRRFARYCLSDPKFFYAVPGLVLGRVLRRE